GYRLEDEVKSYARPIPACDAQFNALLQERAGVERDLNHLDDAAIQGSRHALESFLHSTTAMDEDHKERIRAALAKAGPNITLRCDLRPGDIGAIVHLHGVTYARDSGFGVAVEAYVAEPPGRFVRTRTARARLWIAERGGQLVGCIAIVSASEREAQLRWYLVEPSARGVGLGKRLLAEAVQFARDAGYDSVFLWTVSSLTAAARLYRAAGFCKVEEKPGAWGAEVTEEKYVLHFKP